MNAHSRTADDLGPHLFTFAIVTDTHCTEGDGASSSPWPSNKHANARARHVFERIRQAAPQFVLHLGDMVHPVPAQPTFAAAAAKYHEIAAALPCPVHVTPGNHDIGDKPVRWAPAGCIMDQYIRQYEKIFGQSYYAFIARDCRFIVLNASLINSGLAAEGEQKAWLEAEFAKGGPRTFVSIHYPPFICTPDEAGGYDNIDEPGRSWLLDLFKRYKPEAIFSGHVHNYWFDVYAGVKTYILPATSFVRQDYSELYRVEGGPENGRDDTPKLGFCLVDVHTNGHVLHVVRSDGREDTPSATAGGFRRLHTATNTLPPIGVDLRHPWADVIQIPANGGVDEFARKWARNDYPVLALWELGVRNLRVPLQDLVDPTVASRMRLMSAMGSRFTVFCFGVPEAAMQAVVAANRMCVDAVEAVLPWPFDNAIADSLKTAARAMGVRLILSPLQNAHAQTHAGPGSGKHYAHFIRHGFALADRDNIAEVLSKGGLMEVCGGVVFRISRSEGPADQVARAAAWSAQSGVPVRVMVRLAGDNPAGLETDDEANAARVAEAVFAALTCDRVEVFIDTFDDVDRGYFATTGLVDRRYNPRLAGKVMRHLQVAFGLLGRTGLQAGALRATPFGLAAATGDGALILHWPGSPILEQETPANVDAWVERAVDIASGEDLPGGETLRSWLAGACTPALLHVVAPTGQIWDQSDGRTLS